jgi:hypothetical protein
LCLLLACDARCRVGVDDGKARDRHAAIALSEIIDAGESERRGLGLARGRAYDHRNIPGGSKPLGDDFIHLRLVGKHQGQKKEWTSQPRSATSPNGQGASQTT